jgi:hypothetical protein
LRRAAFGPLIRLPCTLARAFGRHTPSMRDSVPPVLATSLRRRIGRRLQLARWSKILLVPTVAVILYLGGRSPWVGRIGVALLILEVVAIMIGEAQRCPLCDASLVLRLEREDEFATACPECGYLID